MTWPFILVILAGLILVSLWVIAALVKKAPETVYVLMWNDAVMGVVSDRTVAQQYVDRYRSAEERHYVRWLPFEIDGLTHAFDTRTGSSHQWRVSP